MNQGNNDVWNNADYVFPVKMRATATITFVTNVGSLVTVTSGEYSQNGSGLHIYGNSGGYGTFTADAEL